MGFKDWKPWVKGGIIAEILLIIVMVYVIIYDSWGIFIIFLAIPLGIVAFLIGAFFGNLFSNGIQKSSDYHKKWMMWNLIGIGLIIIPKFVSNYLSNYNVFSLDGMSPFFYFPLFCFAGIFIIATILFVISKIKFLVNNK